MNWIKENKFLFGFIVVVVIGVGALGYLVLGAKGRHDEATENYQRKLAELTRLQRLPTFPNQKNLDKIVAQQTEVNTEVSALAATLSAQQVPLEEVSPEVFQDRLRAAVTAVRTKAGQSSPPVRIGEKFFLGFDRYENAPPAKEAASAVARELKVLEWLSNTLIENRVTEIKAFDRTELPEEQGKVKQQQAKKPATPAPAKGAKPGPATKDVQHEIERHRVTVTIIADQARFRQVLNAIVSHKGQFIIPRLVQVKNEKPQAPSRVVAAAAAPEGTPAPDGTTPPAAAAAPAPVVSSYIVGEEKIEATLVLEIVEFSEQATTAAK